MFTLPPKAEKYAFRNVDTKKKSRKDGVINLEQNAQNFKAGHGPMYLRTEHYEILLPAKATRVNSSLCPT